VYATPVSVEAGRDVPVAVTIVPTPIEIRVFAKDKPQTDASVRLDHAAYLWTSTIECDERGMATAELWQPGKFWILTLVKGRVADGEVQTFAGDRDHITWETHLPVHLVRGHVVDASTGAPIQAANLSLEVTGKGVRTAISDQDGTFEFEAVGEGHHLLRTYKKGYRLPEPSPVTLTADDVDADARVELTPEGTRRQAHVVDASGSPVVGADAFFGFGAYVQPIEASDDTGSLTLPEGSGSLFVIPAVGSFAMRSIQADEPGPISMTVPPGLGSINVTSETTDHSPLPFIIFALRMNGTLIPPSVISRLASRQRMAFRTDADGRAQLSGLPLGRYDIWPVRTRGELDAIFNGLAPEPAATVVLTTTPQAVTLTFRQKTP
jgi:hypothetical protein